MDIEGIFSLLLSIEMNGKELISLLLFICIYFIPTVVANTYEHPNRRAIFYINLFLGWTLLGWAVACIWSMKIPSLTIDK